MEIKELINEITQEEFKTPRKGSKARTRFDSFHDDYKIILGRYKNRAKALLSNPDDFANEMIERFPTVRQDAVKDEILETYREFAKQLAEFYEWKGEHPKISLDTAMKIYNWRSTLAPQYMNNVKKYIKDSMKEIEKGGK